MTRGERFKSVRQKEKLNQTDFSEKIGISQQTWSEYENSETITISGNTLLELLKQYKINPIWLLHGNGRKYTTQEEKLPSSILDSLDLAKKFEINVEKCIENEVITTIFATIFPQEQGLRAKLKNILLPNNANAFLLMNVLMRIDKDKAISTTFKEYLIEEINIFQTTFLYSSNDKKKLRTIISALDEDSCRRMVFNVNRSIQENQKQIDSFTQSINSYATSVKKLFKRDRK